MNVIGIESSCDETSVAIIKDNVLASNLISSQDFHFNFGGVVPELSSRAHLQIVLPLVKKALAESKLELNEIDLICATAGPGLIGALLVGLTFAKGLAFSLNKKFVAVNHIEGHIFSGFLMEQKPKFPYLAVVVSGGHTLLLLVEDYMKIVKLGTTVDDAAGEAFDKVSKMLGLGYPGGPKIQAASLKGNPDKINFPIAELKDRYNFSFSGLKTSVLRYLQKNFPDGDIKENELFDIAASFQKAVVKAITNNTEKAINDFKVNSISLVGGVAANKALRNSMIELGRKNSIDVVIPSMEYCGDNAAMIAYRGQKLFENGISSGFGASPFPSLNNNSFIHQGNV